MTELLTRPATEPATGDRARRYDAVFRGAWLLGEIIATLGVVVVLYAVYSLFWTNLTAHGAAADELQNLERSWADRDVAEPPAPVPGRAFALMTIPRLGEDWKTPIIEGSGIGSGGIDTDELARGVVHYPKTQLPGQLGNFAVAGHRATHGEPFSNLDRMRRGDTISVQRADKTYTYVVTGKEIVQPTATDVLAPVPRNTGAKADRQRLTLTTCHPRWASTSRLIVYAELKRSSSPTPVGG